MRGMGVVACSEWSLWTGLTFVLHRLKRDYTKRHTPKSENFEMNMLNVVASCKFYNSRIVVNDTRKMAAVPIGSNTIEDIRV